MKKFALAVFVLTCVFTIPAHAQFHHPLIGGKTTGNDLLQILQNCIPPGTEVNLNDARQVEAVEACVDAHGFIDGILTKAEVEDTETRRVTGFYLGGKRFEEYFDIPQGVTYPQIWDVVRHFLESHPEIRQREVVWLIVAAVSDAWPGKLTQEKKVPGDSPSVPK